MRRSFHHVTVHYFFPNFAVIYIFPHIKFLTFNYVIPHTT